MYLKEYRSTSSGIRFKRRVYWSKNTYFGICYRNKSLNYYIARLSHGCALTRSSKSTRISYLSWCNIYDCITHIFFIIYSKQHTSGITLNACFNRSLFFINSVYNYTRGDMTFFLGDLKYNTAVSNIELYINGGSQLSKSAGTHALILNWARNNKRIVKLPSWSRINISPMCRSSIGSSNNLNCNKENYSKAGTSWRMGNVLRVNGLAMNSCDHPHGGRSGPGRSLKSPWGWITK